MIDMKSRAVQQERQSKATLLTYDVFLLIVLVPKTDVWKYGIKSLSRQFSSGLRVRFLRAKNLRVVSKFTMNTYNARVHVHTNCTENSENMNGILYVIRSP